MANLTRSESSSDSMDSLVPYDTRIQRTRNEQKQAYMKKKERHANGPRRSPDPLPAATGEAAKGPQAAIIVAPEECKREKEGATGGAVIVAPQNCQVMVGFNMASAGDEAKELTEFLNARGFATFSTCVYCPANPGSDWKKSTNHGIANAKVLVTLITKGWATSEECAKETNTFQMLMNEDKEKSIIPVNFPGITRTDYKDPDSVLFNMMTVQQIEKKFGWMEAVLQGVRNAMR